MQEPSLQDLISLVEKDDFEELSGVVGNFKREILPHALSRVQYHLITHCSITPTAEEGIVYSLANCDDLVSVLEALYDSVQTLYLVGKFEGGVHVHSQIREFARRNNRDAGIASEQQKQVFLAAYTSLFLFNQVDLNSSALKSKLDEWSINLDHAECMRSGFIDHLFVGICGKYTGKTLLSKTAFTFKFEPYSPEHIVSLVKQAEKQYWSKDLVKKGQQLSLADSFREKYSLAVRDSIVMAVREQNVELALLIYERYKQLNISYKGDGAISALRKKWRGAATKRLFPGIHPEQPKLYADLDPTMFSQILKGVQLGLEICARTEGAEEQVLTLTNELCYGILLTDGKNQASSRFHIHDFFMQGQWEKAGALIEVFTALENWYHHIIKKVVCQEITNSADKIFTEGLKIYASSPQKLPFLTSISNQINTFFKVVEKNSSEKNTYFETLYALLHNSAYQYVQKKEFDKAVRRLTYARYIATGKDSADYLKTRKQFFAQCTTYLKENSSLLPSETTTMIASFVEQYASYVDFHKVDVIKFKSGKDVSCVKDYFTS